MTSAAGEARGGSWLRLARRVSLWLHRLSDSGFSDGEGAPRPMRLDPIVRDFPGYLRELENTLASSDTLVYLDTSLLMWFLRVEPEVRADFIAWCDGRPLGTVRVPVWVAHELHRHLQDRREFKNVQAAVSKVRVGTEVLGELAAERSTDGRCRMHGYTGRDAFVGDVEATLEKLDAFLKTVELEPDKYLEAADSIIAFVNDRLLGTNLAQISSELSLSGRFRNDHRIPPGYMDDKEENRHGDIIIWEEIVEDLASAGPAADGTPRRALFLTRDAKEDWLSKSSHVLLDTGKVRGVDPRLRVEVKRPHPLLSHELSVRAQGAKIYITHPAFLAVVLQRAGAAPAAGAPVQWWRASYRHAVWQDLAQQAAWGFSPPSRAEHRDAATETEGGSTGTERTPPAPPPVLPVVVGPPLSEVGRRDALANRVAEFIRVYREAVPGTESSVIEAWIVAVAEGRMTPFTLGAIFAHLTESVPGWGAQVRALLGRIRARFGTVVENQVVLAFAGTAYFDADAQIRKRPQRAVGEVVSALESEEQLAPAFAALNRFLVEADAKLVYVPGSGREAVDVEVVASRVGRTARLVHEIRVGGYQVLAEGLQPDSPRTLTILLGHGPEVGCPHEELRALVAWEYLIPIGRVRVVKGTSKFSWTEDKGLLDMDTDAEGGVSELVTVEETND